jgi:very-short-patch-repair endonuclease
VFYETAPGGAGYLEQLAGDLGLWAKAAQDRLFNHDCERACYRCLKSARNQFDHALLDKERVRSVLFQLAEAAPTEPPRSGRAGDGRNATVDWLDRLKVERKDTETSNTAIEKALLQAIRDGGRLPEPTPQYEISDENGKKLTIPDFAYTDRRIAIYCDGFAYHGNREALESDAKKRNVLQSMGWAVLIFWGRQILRNPSACEAQIWQCYQFR